jgi:hypothetical protein
MDTKGPQVTPQICGAIGENAQVILVGVKNMRVRNAFHPHILRVKRIRPKTMHSLWCANSRELKNTSIGVVS